MSTFVIPEQKPTWSKLWYSDVLQQDIWITKSPQAVCGSFWTRYFFKYKDREFVSDVHVSKRKSLMDNIHKGNFIPIADLSKYQGKLIKED